MPFSLPSVLLLALSPAPLLLTPALLRALTLVPAVLEPLLRSLAVPLSSVTLLAPRLALVLLLLGQLARPALVLAVLELQVLALLSAGGFPLLDLICLLFRVHFALLLACLPLPSVEVGLELALLLAELELGVLFGSVAEVEDGEEEEGG